MIRNRTDSVLGYTIFKVLVKESKPTPPNSGLPIIFNMSGLPSEIILEILSRMPIKSLARFRCVFKLWCHYIDDDSYLSITHGARVTQEEPTPIIILHLYPVRILSLSNNKSEKGTTVLEVKRTGFQVHISCSYG